MGNDSESAVNQVDLINDLQQFDLSKEEAEIYLCLLKNKVMTVREINQSIPQIQRTYLYNFLDKLHNNEWVHINKTTKPQTFNPMPPDETITKIIDEKRNFHLKKLEEINQVEEKVLPDLLRRLNVIHQKDVYKQIPKEFNEILSEYFEDNPSVRIEYSYASQDINPWLNIFFLSCTFHGFFISWHKKPVSDEYSIHFYEFETPITQTHLDLATKVMELQAEDMIKLLTEREGIDRIQRRKPNSFKMNGFKMVQETFVYIKSEQEHEALIIHPWKLNQNTLAFFYSNKKEKGMKLLDWLIQKAN